MLCTVRKETPDALTNEHKCNTFMNRHASDKCDTKKHAAKQVLNSYTCTQTHTSTCRKHMPTYMQTNRRTDFQTCAHTYTHTHTHTHTLHYITSVQAGRQADRLPCKRAFLYTKYKRTLHTCMHPYLHYLTVHCITLHYMNSHKQT